MTRGGETSNVLYGFQGVRESAVPEGTVRSLIRPAVVFFLPIVMILLTIVFYSVNGSHGLLWEKQTLYLCASAGASVPLPLVHRINRSFEKR